MLEVRRSSEPKLLVVHGSDEHDQLLVSGERAHNRGSTDLYRVLGDLVPYRRLHVTRHFFRQPRRPVLDPYSHVLNIVTDPDQNPKVLENVARLLRGYRGEVINRPEAVLRTTRDQVAQRLASVADLITPKVLRIRTSKPALAAQMIEAAGLRFPLILRHAGTHTGKIVGVYEDVASLTSALEPGVDHLAIEFVDFAGPDGLYRKYRTFFIGRHIIVRHMLVSDHWNVHAKDRTRFMIERPELLAEERPLFDDPQNAFAPAVRAVLDGVRERMGLDFFGMDFGIAPDARVVLFEANPTMNFMPFPRDERLAHTRRCIGPVQRALWELVGFTPPPNIARAINSLEAPVSPDPNP